MTNPEVRIFGPPAESELAEAKRARGTILTQYIDGLDDFERTTARERAEELYTQGGYLPQLVAITPVAAHQERPETILQALGQYAGQKEAGEFAVILGFNYPPEEMGSPRIARCYDAVKKAKKLYPHLDVRVLEECYGDFTISGVRRDLWNAALALVDKHTQEVGYQETLGMTHDIDLVTMSPHLLQRARMFQAHTLRYASMDLGRYGKGESRPFHSKTKHDYDPRFPNIARATLWSDATYARSDGYFEAGTFIPFIYYADQGGYDASLVLAETHELFGRSGASWSPEAISYTGLDSVYSATSNRRYVQELQTHGYDGMWTEENFSNSDPYRSSLDGFTDISKDALRNIIRVNLHAHVERMMKKSTDFALWGKIGPGSPEKAATLVRRDLLFVNRLLGETLDLKEFHFFVNRNFGEREEWAPKLHKERLAKLQKSRPIMEKLVQKVLDDTAPAHVGLQDVRDA
ncbi:MAG: hypothetical protein WAO28_04050 [Candidatus Microsaccharimonas sp.]